MLTKALLWLFLFGDISVLSIRWWSAAVCNGPGALASWWWIFKCTDSLTLVVMSVYDAKSPRHKVMHFAHLKWCLYISRTKWMACGLQTLMNTRCNVYHEYSYITWLIMNEAVEKVYFFLHFQHPFIFLKKQTISCTCLSLSLNRCHSELILSNENVLLM